MELTGLPGRPIWGTRRPSGAGKEPKASGLPGRIWVAWEEGGSALDEESVRQAGLDLGLVDDKRAAFGDRWVGLRLKRESRARPSRPGSRQPSIADA